MIFIFTALYPEAKPLIRMLGLKKRTDRTRFQQFVSSDYMDIMVTMKRMSSDGSGADIRPDIVLVITGVGPVNAAAAVSATLTEYDAGSADQMLSFGTAAFLHGAVKSNGTAGVFLLNKLLDQNAGRCFYPDMLIKCDIPEASAITGSTVLSERAAAFMAVSAENYDIYDMEAAAVYQTSAFYIGPHQMSFIRVVTDSGISDDIKDIKSLSEMVAATVEKYVDQILCYVDKLRELSLAEVRKMKEPDEKDSELVDKIINDAHFSRVMQDQFRQYVKFAVLSGINWREEAERLYREGELPTIDKRKGKKVLDAIRNSISE
ncbi:hypothetical protein [Oribacterium sp. WCC10]|uniref:hypothetical protein n=1 Tax=Oribacterium sp. WCC10 TaxID=1855343 RepID=UPI0008E6046D|nr:hypothetical protein [Oribacterium sp. WCC10]SFG15133.1 hypothetical protein SAMN05216356_102172 [Oribacterium sp. WCC10]